MNSQINTNNQSATVSNKENKMNTNIVTDNMINDVIKNNTDGVEVVEFRRLETTYYVTLFSLDEENEANAMDAIEEQFNFRIKTIKREDGYARIVYERNIQTETIENKEIKMNTINFVVTPEAEVVVIDSTPTKRTPNVHIKALLPAVSQSTMRERMKKNEVAKREAEIKAQLGFRPTPKADQQMKESVVPAKTTPSIQAEVDKLKAVIASLSPEAHAEAVKMGIIRGAQAQFNREMNSIKHVGIDRQKTKGEVKTGNRSNAIGKRQRAEVIKRECACGCGQLTGGNFAMGHDARAKGQWLRMLRGTQLVNEVGWTPTAALVAYAIANPQWSSEIYAAVMSL